MVEMLGTLAIMGVLSVGAVAGYRYAITKYQANETTNELKRRVVIHSQQAMVGVALDQTEMGEYTSLGYPIDVYDMKNGSFELEVQDMDKELCDALIKANWTLPIQTRVNDLLGGSCQNEGNTIAFQFQTTMSGCTSDSECLCGTCQDGKCISDCPVGQVCVKSFDTGTYGCYPPNEVTDDIHCDNPNPNGDGTCCDENGENCCPPDKPLYTRYGGCVTCDDVSTTKETEIFAPSRQLCNRCANRMYRNIGINNIGYCILKQCPDDKPVQSFSGQCYPCDYDGFIEQNHTFTSQFFSETCSMCSNRFVHNGGCAIGCPDNTILKDQVCTCNDEYPVMDKDGNCHACSEDDPIAVGFRQLNRNTCSLCDGTSGKEKRRLYTPDVNQWGFCAKEQCPQNDMIHNGKGECHSCSASYDIEMKVYNSTSPDDCAADCNGVRYLDGTTCKKCPTDTSALTPEQQAQCTPKT